MDTKEISSVLMMGELLFEEISFERKGMKNDKELKFEIEIGIGTSAKDKNLHKVIVKMKGDKPEEFSFVVSLAGIFRIDMEHEDAKKIPIDVLLNQNAVALLLPYIRAQITLLTSQPGVEPVVLPPINVKQLMVDNKTNI